MDAPVLLSLRVAPALAAALLHSLWQVALLAGGAWLALWALSRHAAATRHAVAMGFLLAMVLAPASTFLRMVGADGAQLNSGWLPAVTPPQLDAATGHFVQQSNPLAALLVMAWLVGVGAMLLRRFGGWRLLRALDRHPSTALPPPWQARLDAMRAAMGISRTVVVRLSAEVAGPFTARLLRPVVWLPLSLLAQLPRDQVEALLAHELAHIARMDWLWNGAQCVLEALLFFHPAAWWLGRRIRQEREHACDDTAVAVCGDAIALAEALAQLERQRPSTPRLVLAAQGGSLMKRITRLLAVPPVRARWGAAIGTGLLVVAGVLVVAQLSLAHHGRHAIELSSTTAGALGPGDSREISAYGPDGWRHYTVRVGANGAITESLEVDGKPRPVTDETRTWIGTTLSLAAPPAPPKPPKPPAPPIGPLAPPLPPPPEIVDNTMVKVLIQHVAIDPAVVARLGSPVVMASKDVDGRLDIGNGARADGDADLRLRLRGPKGMANVRVTAQLVAGEWSTPQVAIEGDAR
ncbi:M56 family metallopeptidase [Cognatiluteimonas telluris]|jgi:beta-lactamase regulating signal transducer with metallopeptidase domain|uniref:M56 family metallopeptidase n=1 Tax=Cognatiluteimonas telluris TaxID=1104775 RepID=UPI00140837C5|nr:M56 family metallopeptidase [Lysobacter telluris]